MTQMENRCVYNGHRPHVPIVESNLTRNTDGPVKSCSVYKDEAGKDYGLIIQFCSKCGCAFIRVMTDAEVKAYNER